MKINSLVNPEIVSELYGALVLLSADSGLLATVGSWGDSLSDEEVLANLKGWNGAALTEAKGRIEHYEISRLHPAYSHCEAL